MGERHAAQCLRHDLAYSQRRIRERRGDGRRRAPCRRCGKALRYEVGADRCALCSAHNERNPPWWRDGRIPIWMLVCIACAPAVGRAAMGVAPAGLLPRAISSHTVALTAALCAGALLVGAPAALWRIRRAPNGKLRALMLIAIMAYCVGLAEVVLRMR